MAHSTRRFLFPAVLLLLITLISAGQIAAPAEVARAKFDENGPAFDDLSTFDTSVSPVEVRQPPRLLAGTNSHSLPASATLRNGYCLDVNVDGISPVVAGNIPESALGFRTFATNPIDPNAPQQIEVPLPTGGTYVPPIGVVGPGLAPASVNNAVSPSSDDAYCVVVHAPEGYRNLTIEWHYQISGDGDNIIAIEDIPIITVTLEKIGDGLINAPAEVCTVGWDGTFLTGRDSNVAGDEPDPVNIVDVADFVIIPTVGPNGTPTVDYVRQVGPEWCAGIASDAPETGLDVRFDFDAVYSRVSRTLITNNDDDQPVPTAPQLAPDRYVTIKDLVELRHVTIDGQIPPRQRSAPLALHFRHYVCLVGTDSTEGDTLASNNILFQNVGVPDAPTVSGLTVFSKSDIDNNPRLGGVQENTLCFSYTSASPGEHTIQVTFINRTDPGDPGVQAVAFFDTDGDGNGITDNDSPAGPLVTQWNRIDETVISQGQTFEDDVITFTTRELGLQFNALDGTYIASFSATEWVLGSHRVGGERTDLLLLDGALLQLSISGGCGYFVTPDEEFGVQPTELSGISIGGRFEITSDPDDPFAPLYGDDDADPDDIQFSTLNSAGCTPNSKVTISVSVYYRNDLDETVLPDEWVDLRFSFLPNMKTPRVAWAGEYVTITYAFAGDEELCDDSVVHFVRPKGQTGTFIAEPGIILNGPDHAMSDFDECTATVRYESESPGEVDVEAFIEGNEYSKFAFPIFFLVFEDITVDATPDQFVSTFGDVTADVRGYFPGTNPSGRAAETKADGRRVPKDRWVLPDDWELLKGQSDLRTNWGSVQMPAAIVTFFMENEGVVNGYKSGVRVGGSGFMIPDTDDDYSFDVNPHTGVRTKLGQPGKPRMMSALTDGNGSASIDTFGDFNLTYEECAANVITGNPHCAPEDIVGHTRWFAVVEYPQDGNRGKHPAIASNVAQTDWRWAGYKAVTIVNTDSPQIKYVVAHLRDRDGFCDAANYNNTLGVPVKFEIDAGGGVILEAEDQPSVISGGRRFATATTYDTIDALGNPINTHLAKPTYFAESPDECQAWIKITNSLLVPTNVMVTFPAPPSPVPGDIRITGLQCEGTESITVTNFGSNPVSLAGFALESVGDDVGNAEQLDLIGLLEPGQSKSFPGGPGANTNGWIQTGSEVFVGANDFAALTWNDWTLSVALCSGPIEHFEVPNPLPLDGEGDIVLDIIIPFGEEQSVPLVQGWNLVPTGEGTVSIEAAFGNQIENVYAVYIWDAVLGEWQRWIPGAPAAVNTIDTIGNGVVMWVWAKQSFTLTIPR